MKEIKLTKGMVAIVDDEDYERVMQYKWYAQRSGKRWYAYRTEWPSRKGVAMHRFITGVETGMDVDHINGNSLDNRKDNLRAATRGQNMHNRGKQTNNTSGFKGVYFDKITGRWRASISVDHRVIRLGRFDTSEEAAIAYDNAASRYVGEFARLNLAKPSTEIE